MQWITAKICNIFKKRNSLVHANYMGISIKDALYKVFNCILIERFNLWLRPNTEQAGARAGSPGSGVKSQNVKGKRIVSQET